MSGKKKRKGDKKGDKKEKSKENTSSTRARSVASRLFLEIYPISKKHGLQDQK